MYRKLILYLLAVLTILFQSVGIENMNLEEKKKISVEIKGEVEKQGVYEMDLGSTLEDLLKSTKPYPDAGPYSDESSSTSFGFRVVG